MSPSISALWRPLFDNWTPLDYKRVQQGSQFGVGNWVTPTWVGYHHRRLQAYKILQSYVDNSSRYFLSMVPNASGQFSSSDKDDHREYGDANALVEVIMSAVIGDSQEIHVEGADQYDENAPDAPAGNGPNTDARDYPKSPTDQRTEPNTPESKAAWELQTKLREWADAERLPLKMVQAETDAVALGDGVYALGYDGSKERPVLTVYDPGFYFPVEDDWLQPDEFPKRVHFAWDMLDDYEQPTKKVRRITYDLRPVPPYAVQWSDKPATVECFMTDAIYEVQNQNVKVDDFTIASSFATITDEQGNELQVDDLPLGIDYIPVVHMPNTVPKGRFGRSSISPVLQALDDLQSADSDHQKAMALTGSPMLAFSGTNATSDVRVGPGEAVNLGENGKVDVIDASKGLAEMRLSIDGLLKRITVNGRVPDAVLGRVDAHKVSAGIVLTLSFGPLITMVRQMRLVRDEKYTLLLKFVQRFYQLKGQLPAGDTQRANVVMGSFLPSDQAAVATMVNGLRAANGASRATTTRMLMEAGFPIDDISEELTNISAEDFAGAFQLWEATQDPEVVGEYLGVKITPQTPDPITLNLPGKPPDAKPNDAQPPNNAPTKQR